MAIHTKPRKKMRLSSQVDPVVGVGAGVLALVSGFFSVHVIILSVLAPVASMLDLLSGARKASVHKRMGLPGGYDKTIRDEGLINKGMLIFAVLTVGISIDLVLKLGTDATGIEAANWFDSYSPILTISLAWFWAREITSAMNNIATTPGSEGALWPGLVNIVQGIRYRITGKNPPPQSRVQPGHWINEYPEETQTKLRAIIQEDVEIYKKQRGPD